MKNKIVIPDDIDKYKKTKEKVLSLLNANNNIYISGQDVATSLFVTRAGVWKAITALRNQGYQIEAISNRGYRLIDNQQISLSSLNSMLNKEIIPSNFEIFTFDEVSSTNDVASSYSAEGKSNDFVVISSSQTSGRGRRGRSFYSPKDTGIYLSLLIHPSFDIEHSSILTCLSATALCLAIKAETNIETQIKWVNDIFYNNRKIAGILTEASTSIEDGTLNHIVIGVGINLITPSEGFPAYIKDTAGALLTNGTTPENIKNRICASFINKFYEYYNEIHEKTFLPEYIERSFLIGKHIKINNYANESDLIKKDSLKSHNYALVTGINNKCHLQIKYEDGITDELKTGEVSVIEY